MKPAAGPASKRERLDSLFRDEKTDVVGICRSGDAAALKAALANGGSVNATDMDGHPALLLAADREDGLPLVEVLLKAGAKPDVPNSRGLTALMAAARRTDAPMMELLLEAGASAEAADNDGLTAMEHVQRFAPSAKGKAGMKKLKAIALLVEAATRRRDDPKYEYQGLTALHWGAVADDAALMERMLQFGAEPFRPAKDGTTVMEKAFQHKETRAVMFRELAIQFRSDFERLRKAGNLKTRSLIEFFEKKGMKSPGGFSLWSLSEVQPVLEFLNEKNKQERIAPELSKRQLNRFEQVASLATVAPSAAARLSQRLQHDSEIMMGIDLVSLRLAGLTDDDLILQALQRKHRTPPSGFGWRGDEVDRLSKKFSLGAKRAGSDFLEQGASEVIGPVANSLRDAGMLTGHIADLMVERELFPQSYLGRLKQWLHEHFGEPHLEAA